MGSDDPFPCRGRASSTIPNPRPACWIGCWHEAGRTTLLASVEAGPLLAAANSADPDHSPCVDVVAPEPGDWVRIGEFIRKYDNLPLDTVDASVVVLAERM